jgi:hypothetical protein
MVYGKLSIHAAFIDQLVTLTLQGKVLKRQIRRRSRTIIAHYRHLGRSDEQQKIPGDRLGLADTDHTVALQALLLSAPTSDFRRL